MRRMWLMEIVMILAAFAVLAIMALSSDASPIADWTVHFSPKGGCTDVVVATIRSAKKSVRLSAYALTSAAVVDALTERHDAGVDVAVVVDSSYAESRVVKKLRAARVPTWSDGKHAIMHDKYVIVDDRAVETGSFNFTVAAENSNAENCMTLVSAELAKMFRDDWERHKGHSRRLP